MHSVSQSAERTPDENAKDASTITDPLAKNSHQLAKSGRIAFFDVQFDQTGFELPRADVVNVEDHLRSIGETAGVQVEYTGDAESPPPEQGMSDILRLIAAIVVL